MANKNVANSTTGTMGIKAYKRSRYEKMETAYGKIPAAAYDIDTDSLVFNLPAKELIYFRAVFSANGKADAAAAAGSANVEAIEVFCGADLSSALGWVVSTSTEADINWVAHYIKGSGKAHPGLANASSEVAGEQGVRLVITPTSS